MIKNILDLTEDHVKALLSEGLTNDHRYHNLAHTLSVREACEILSIKSGIPEDRREVLLLTALLHDTGFVRQYLDHESASQDIAGEWLGKQGYPNDRLKEVLQLIDATRPEKPATSLEEKIIKDADLNNVGSDGYLQVTDNLRHEWQVFLGKEQSEMEWYNENINFLKEHQFLTPAALELYSAQKDANLKMMKKLRKKLRKDNKQEPERELIRDNRSAQMMFKTALRNHIDLTSIADSKANIMLSINSLIITLSMPLLASNLQENPFLMIPSAILLATCVISIIFATLATRPVKTSGKTKLENIRTGTTNLFFFGNFYKMDLGTYKKGILEIISDDELMDDTVMTDLYFLGKALGSKFNQLRTCYSIFMVGITASVIAFVLAFLLSA